MRYDGDMRYSDDRERLRHVRRPIDLPLVTVEGIIMLLVVFMVAGGVLLGFLIGHSAH